MTKVAPAGLWECWEWTAARTYKGYGVIGRQTDDGHRNVPAHRIGYEHFIAPIPDGYEIDHLCRNRGCVNPLHLEAVTQRVNLLRGISPPALKARQTHCDKGHPFPEKRTKNGNRRCMICLRAWQRANPNRNEWRKKTFQANPERWRAKRRALTERHRDRIRAYERKRSTRRRQDPEHREYMKAYQRAYYQRNKAKVLTQ